ncbi:MAG: hypothetical protein HFI99_13665 [Lachnospiraceae bacterium]|nr:hypothetical protein [Lachnospiraceae bacterium]
MLEHGREVRLAGESCKSFAPVLRNTIVISLLKLIPGFPIPVILALMMNEMRSLKFKKVSQTLLYLPHFISWVILSGIIMTLPDPDNGMITNFLQMITGQQIMVLTDSRYFIPMLYRVWRISSTPAFTGWVLSTTTTRSPRRLACLNQWRPGIRIWRNMESKGQKKE